jgi:hypothetical protein
MLPGCDSTGVIHARLQNIRAAGRRRALLWVDLVDSLLVCDGRVLIWSNDSVFVETVSDSLTLRHFAVVECAASPGIQVWADVVVADIDGLSPSWCEDMAQLRMRNELIAPILVTARWPNIARLHAWRSACGVRSSRPTTRASSNRDTGQ